MIENPINLIKRHRAMKLKFNPFHYPARLLAALALTLSAIQANAATLTWSTTSGSTITDATTVLL
jgi:hypothetical protein